MNRRSRASGLGPITPVSSGGAWNRAAQAEGLAVEGPGRRRWLAHNPLLQRVAPMPDPTDLLGHFDLVLGEDVRPADADLDAFEARFGLRLPDDYRAFVKAFGAGTIDEVGINYMYAPVTVPPEEHDLVDLTLLNSGSSRQPSALSVVRHWIDAHDLALLADPHARTVHANGRAELVELERRLSSHVDFFLAAEGDDHFAWDRDEVTDPSTGDMAIVLVQLHHKRVERVASTFREFLLDYLLGGRYHREHFGDGAGYHPDPNRVVEYYQYQYNIS